MNKTQIEWVKNPDGSQGYTWNPITGCLNGCEYCYARRLANTRLRERYLANRNVSPVTDGINDLAYSLRYATPFYPRFWPERLEQPMKIKKPAGIFVCDMSDLFGIGIPEQWTWSVLNFIKASPQHRFYLLTKQPQNLAKFSPFPDNCWVGVTVCNQEMADYAIPLLTQIDAPVRYVSFEPLQGSIDLSAYRWLSGCNACCNGDRCDNPSHYFRPQCPVCKGTAKGRNIDWVIIGAQTKPYKPPKIEWVEEIVRACDKAGVAVFLKDNLKPLLWNEKERVLTPVWARMLGPYDGLGGFLLRQELPK